MPEEKRKSAFVPSSGWKETKTLPLKSGEGVSTDIIGASKIGDSGFLWEYQWEDSLNAINERVVEPPLAKRIVSQLVDAAVVGLPNYLVFVRGDLGIGKSTLVELLNGEIELRANAFAQVKPKIANALYGCSVLEARDLEGASNFASRVNEALTENRYTVALARPGMLETAALWIARHPNATVTMRTFEPGRPVFHHCLSYIAGTLGLNEAGKEKLSALAGRLPAFLQTPFYFIQIANAVKKFPEIEENATPLEIFKHSLESKIGLPGIFRELFVCALDKDECQPVAGIVENNRFIHDGYRNVILAVGVLDKTESFDTLIATANSLPAVRILLNHIELFWKRKTLDVNDSLISKLYKFAIDEPNYSRIQYVIYIQGLVANTFRNLKNDRPAEIIRERCLKLIRERGRDNFHKKNGVKKIFSIIRMLFPSFTDIGKKKGGDDSCFYDQTLWWDVSDALSLIRDFRLLRAQREHFSINSGYFSEILLSNVVIGSNHIPKRDDDAKPVLPYNRTNVPIGPFWVSNFLVTNELFREFWTDPQRDTFFRGTGAQWVRGDAKLMDKIGELFDLSARRCFWKEMQEQHSIKVSGVAAESIPILEIARDRALRKGRIALWDPTQADDRFSADGNPVVGVTWWEAMAFCEWWTSRKIKGAGFPSGAMASLLADWEWEAIRRLYYEGAQFPDVDCVQTGRYPAHLRRLSGTSEASRINNSWRPLHVGLAPTATGKGPLDMVGNVWEWTRSRVFGQICSSDQLNNTKFGDTIWDHGDEMAERIPIYHGREEVNVLDDLTYRAVRGGSFFSMDQQAAWHPAYRLCDPPFSSYFDLGFRFAVYPKEN